MKPAREAFKIGQLVKVKGRPANRSPYQVVCGFKDEETVLVEAIDKPGNGNRKERRAEWRRRQKTK